MVYDKTYMLSADGNYALAVTEGSFGGKPAAYYDLFRMENEKIAEHWDVMSEIPHRSQWQNDNGKF